MRPLVIRSAAAAAFGAVVLFGSGQTLSDAQEGSAAEIPIGPADLGSVVRGAKGPEPGVWVCATNSSRAPFHSEGETTRPPSVFRFQLRTHPLAR